MQNMNDGHREIVRLGAPPDAGAKQMGRGGAAKPLGERVEQGEGGGADLAEIAVLRADPEASGTKNDEDDGVEERVEEEDDEAAAAHEEDEEEAEDDEAAEEADESTAPEELRPSSAVRTTGVLPCPGVEWAFPVCRA